MKLLLWALCVLAALTAAVSVNAATLTVTKTADTNDGTCSAADCSLREAAAAAVSGDTIAFASPLFDSARTITLGSEIAVSGKNLTITGPGADKLTVDGGAGSNRVFYLAGGTFTVSGMKLTGGGGGGAVHSGYGGAILVIDAGATLDGLHVTGNSASWGGGVTVSTTGTHASFIRNSTFSGNSSTDYGSAINHEFSLGTLTITNTTVSGNTAAFTSAIVQVGSGDMTIQNSTVTGNSGVDNGGIYADTTLHLRGSVVAGNTGSMPEMWLPAAQVSEGFNLIGDSSGDSSNTDVPMTFHPTDIRDTDPQLGALTNNLGTTPVHTPAAGSPVVDKGSAFGQTTDQRGSSRTYDNPSVANASGGDGTDIGSVELQAPLAAQVFLAGRVTNAFGRPIRGAEVVIQGGGVTRRVLTSQFGFYRVSGLEAGEVYFISVRAVRHSFQSATRTVTPSDNLSGIDFTAQP